MYEIFFVIDNDMSWKTIFLLQSVSHNERQVLGHDQEHCLMGRKKKVYASSQNDKQEMIDMGIEKLKSEILAVNLSCYSSLILSTMDYLVYT
jgi:hypothetical protein